MTEVRELSEAPSMRSLYPRALIGFVPGGPDTLPATELLLNDVAIDRGHLTAYERVCGFRPGDDAPSTYPHLLGFPLQMKLMTGRDFPFPAIGLVHVENRIEQHRPLRAGETVSLRVHAADLRDHDKGRQFDVVADVLSGGETVWHSRSTYLRRGGGSGSDKKGNDRPQAPQPNAIWDIPGDTGRRYGSVSATRSTCTRCRPSCSACGAPSPTACG